MILCLDMDKADSARAEVASRLPKAMTKVELTKTNNASTTSSDVRRLTPCHSRARMPQSVLNTITNARWMDQLVKS